jgi:dephospho-CoA kinase
VKVVGLTGGIGSGKSTVSAMLRERGAIVVDADAVVKELQQPGMPVFEAMVERFGPGIVAADGTLDRQAVADVVFNDADALAALNAIVHPAVGLEVWQRIAAHDASDHVVIADIPLLAEGNSAIPMSGVVVVDTPEELQVERLVGQRGMDEADARARIGRQATREARLAKADKVVDNSGSLEELVPQVDEVWAWAQALPATEWPAPAAG